MNLVEMRRRVVLKRATAGLGLFAGCTFKKGIVILEFQGELITHAEADRRGGKYLFYVNRKYMLDGTARTNLARYLNHACQPNAAAIVKGHRIYIRALQPIAAGEEITIDYGAEYYKRVIEPKGCKCLQHAKPQDPKSKAAD